MMSREELKREVEEYRAKERERVLGNIEETLLFIPAASLSSIEVETKTKKTNVPAKKKRGRPVGWRKKPV